MSTAAAQPMPWQADTLGSRVARRTGRRVEAFPAGMVISIDTHEFDEFSELATGWSIQHHPLGDRACRSTVFLVKTPSLQVARVQHAMGYCSQGENPAGMLSLAVPADEARPMVHRGHTIGSMEVGVTRSGEGFEILCRSGVRFVIASVAQNSAERYAADVWRQPWSWRHASDRLQFVDSAHRSRYLDVCGQILGAVDEQPDLLGNQDAAALLEETLLEGLFLNAHVGASCARERGRYNLARQAYRYLQDRVDQVPSIREICSVTGASYATLERGFRETYGMTPKALMAAMRLSGVRRQLLHPSPTTTVTGVALRWGFVEFGRFSGQYCHRYGEVPKETLRRARGEHPQPDGSKPNGTRSSGLVRAARLVN